MTFFRTTRPPSPTAFIRRMTGLSLKKYPLVLSKKLVEGGKTDPGSMLTLNPDYFNFLLGSLNAVLITLSKGINQKTTHDDPMRVDLLSGHGFLLALLSLLSKNTLLPKNTPFSAKHTHGLQQLKQITNSICHHDLPSLVEGLLFNQVDTVEALRYRLIAQHVALQQALEHHETQSTFLSNALLAIKPAPLPNSRLSHLLFKKRLSMEALFNRQDRRHVYYADELKPIELEAIHTMTRTIDEKKSAHFFTQVIPRPTELRDFGLVFSLSVFLRDFERIKHYLLLAENEYRYDFSTMQAQHTAAPEQIRKMTMKYNQQRSHLSKNEPYRHFANFFRHPPTALSEFTIDYKPILREKLNAPGLGH